MTDERRTAQALRELYELVDDMRRKAGHLHGVRECGLLGPATEWPHDLDTFAARLDSSVRYLTGDDQ